MAAPASAFQRSDNVVYIQITVFNTRTAERKKALFQRTAELLGESPGIRPEDVFVNILEAAKENLVGGPRPRAICLRRDARVCFDAHRSFR